MYSVAGGAQVYSVTLYHLLLLITPATIQKLFKGAELVSTFQYSVL